MSKDKMTKEDAIEILKLYSNYNMAYVPSTNEVEAHHERKQLIIEATKLLRKLCQEAL